MTNEVIEKFLEPKFDKGSKINIRFKRRDNLQGVFLKLGDYNDLKAKNLWRFISDAKFAEWELTKNQNLVRIFNGAEFTKLSEVAL